MSFPRSMLKSVQVWYSSHTAVSSCVTWIPCLAENVSLWTFTTSVVYNLSASPFYDDPESSGV